MRWDELKVDADEGGQLGLPGLEQSGKVIRTFDAPEALDMRFHEVQAKSALNRVPAKSRMPFRWTINAFRGCSHACTFCFARPTHEYLDMNAGRDFEREIVVKVNVPELLRAELRKPAWGRELVALGTNTDPYQWAEGRYRLMPPILDALAESGTPLSILTKSSLVMRDFEQLREISKKVDVTVNFSVPTLEEKAWRATEPHTPHPRKRLEAVAKLNAAGIASGVLIAPLMPGINDSPEQVEEIVRICEEAGASFIGGIGLHLRPGVREVFMDWLRGARPDLVERYEELYRGRAYLPAEERRRIEAPLRKRGRVRRGRFEDTVRPQHR
jgi:DNA repair photolyase